MSHILDKLVDASMKRLARDKAKTPLETLRSEVEALPVEDSFPFHSALAAPGISFICEVKKASPSKGLIAKDFPYLQIAREYEAAGAAAVSVLTETDYFQGYDGYLKEISETVRIPTLRKDFLFEPYQIYQARALGASAVLLICAILDADTLHSLLHLTRRLGMSALVEAHDEAEVEMALKAGARIVGVNNRDLRTFAVDTSTSVQLRKLVPKDVLFVSESGIKTAEDVALLGENGVDAVLVGETLMRSADKKAELDRLRGYAL